MILRRNEDVRRLNEITRTLRDERGELDKTDPRSARRTFAVGDIVLTRVNRSVGGSSPSTAAQAPST